MNILFVAYFYPPQRGIGGKRIFRWARQLAAQGARSFVLTTPPPPERECDNGQETESEGVEVRRAYCPEWLWRLYYGTNQSVRAQVDGPSEPSVKSRLLGKIEEVAHRYYPLDPKIWFAPFASIAALRIASQEKISAAVVTAAPVSSLLVGLALGAAKIPWVADLRDPWSFNFEQQKKAPLMQWIEAQIEALVLHSATRVTFASDNTRKKYALLFPQLAAKFYTLYSGADLTRSSEGPSPSSTDGEGRGEVGVRWVHFGTFYGPRKLGVFIDALAEVIAEENLSPDSFRLLLLGNAAESDLARARELGIEPFIEVRAALPYEEGIALLSRADALLYCDPGREPYFVAGKFFDYLRANRPIFALSASSEINALIKEHALGVTCDPDDLTAIKKKIAAWLTEQPSYQPINIEELSAEHSAKKLSEIFAEISAR